MTAQAASLRSDLAARVLRAGLGVILLFVLCLGPGAARLAPSESPFFAAKAAQYVALPGELRFARPGKAPLPEPPAAPTGLPPAAAPVPAVSSWRLAAWSGDTFGVLPALPPVRPASQAPPLTA